MTETRSTCPYCGVGCGVIVEHDGHRITGVRGDEAHPANFGRLCSKGQTLHLTAAEHIGRQVRLLHPLRREAFGEPVQRVSWESALDEAAQRLSAIVRRDGPDALGIYISGQLLTEDYYIFNKLAKGLLGTNNIDTNSRLCMSSAVAGYKATLGADAPPCSYEDLDLAQTVFISGSNMAWAHPVLFRRLEDAKRANPAQRWIVVDPRRTETAAVADLHLQIQPGTDVALCQGLLHVMLWEGLCDAHFIAEHTDGFDAVRDSVRNATPAHTAKLCGIDEAALVQAARWFAGLHDNLPGRAGSSGRRSPTLSLYCQGLNQSSSGTDKNIALIQLHLATGQVGQPGAGPFSLTGQPNAMGGREVGGLANLLSAHRDMANAQHRAEVAALWGVDTVPAQPGKAAVQMFEAAARGEIKALWIACTNPAQSMPNQALVRQALQRCELVIVQEAFTNTATAAYAHLLLPAASWGEKSGTVTNSERRISRVRAVIAPPGEAREDWAIAAAIGRRLETRLPPRRADGRSLFPYANVEQVWLEHRESTRGRDLDITGLSYAKLEADGPQQWPLPEGAQAGTTRLYTDGRFATADGRARFHTIEPRPLAEKRDAHYPFSLNTGRLRDQWHGMSRTGTLGRLAGHAPEPVLELHPNDLHRLRLNSGDLVLAKSRRGSVVLPVQASEAVAPTQAFIAMHWGSESWVSDDASRPGMGVNTLTVAQTCPKSQQPELKHAAIKLQKVDLPWQLQARAWLPAAQALSTQQALRQACAGLPYAVVLPFGREQAVDASAPDAALLGLWLRIASPGPLPAARLAEIEAMLGLDGAHTLRYADVRRGQHRSLRLHAGAGEALLRLGAWLIAGDQAAVPWASHALMERLPAQPLVRSLLAAAVQPEQALPVRSAQVCNCFDISQAQIDAGLRACAGTPVERLTQLQAQLQCGTQCGSCLPALRQRVTEVPTAATEGTHRPAAEAAA
jgi:assimilatory nitrate reductase catalytic subunit